MPLKDSMTLETSESQMKKGGGGGVIQGNVLTCVKSFSYRGYKILCLYFSQDNNDNETAEESECPFSR